MNLVLHLELTVGFLEVHVAGTAVTDGTAAESHKKRWGLLRLLRSPMHWRVVARPDTSRTRIEGLLRRHVEEPPLPLWLWPRLSDGLEV